MTTPAPEDRRTWFPLILAGVFVLFTITVALFAYLNNRTGDPSEARTVDDVAELSIQAAEASDEEFAGKLLCPQATTELILFASTEGATATKSQVTGVEEGSFRLTVRTSDRSVEYDVTVGLDGERSCIESVRAEG